jgi:hypothetical protein
MAALANSVLRIVIPPEFAGCPAVNFTAARKASSWSQQSLEEILRTTARRRNVLMLLEMASLRQCCNNPT